MKQKAGLPTIVYTLVGLLALAAMVLSLGNNEDRSEPAADSFSPSGTRAFAELLQRNGYRVDIDRTSSPVATAGDLLIGFSIDSEEGPKTSSVRTRARIDDLVDKGTSFLSINLQPDFRKASRALMGSPPLKIQNLISGENLSIASCTNSTPNSAYTAGASRQTLWQSVDGETFLLDFFSRKNGKVIEASDGMFVTNRFIDKNDNASLAVAMVNAVAKPGSRIVFGEGTWNDVQDKGLFATIGGWAVAGYYQTLFLIGVIIFSLGFRFGLPEEMRPRQRGTRDLLDAVSFTFRRGKHARTALMFVQSRFDRDIRSILRLSSDASVQERDRFLTDDFKMTLKQIDAAIDDSKLNTPRALELVAQAQRHLDELKNSRGVSAQ